MGATLTENGELQHILLKNIVLSKRNVRKTLDSFKGIDELAQSIKEIGLLQPVVVFPIVGQKGKFELIVGQRRFLACKKAGLKKILAIVRKPMSDLDALSYSFAENVHREDLDWKDKVEAALILLKDLGSVHAIAKKIGVSETAVRNYLGWAAVPEPIKEMVEKGKLSKQTAKRIAKVNPDPKKATAIAEKVQEAHRREVRNAIIQTNIENPNYTPEQVVAAAPTIKFKHITIDLSNKAADALQKAAEKYDMTPNEIATQTLIDYLRTEGFYQGT